MNNKRLVLFDNIRSLMIVLVVLYHSILPYQTYFSETKGDIFNTTFIYSGQQTLELSLVIFFLDTFMIPLLFFISGYFAVQSIQKYGVKKFIAKRFKRLFIPYLLLCIILLPLIFLPKLLYYDQLTLSNWYSSFGVLARNLFGNTAHLWFLVVLFLYDLLLILLKLLPIRTLKNFFSQFIHLPLLIKVILFGVISIVFSVFIPNLFIINIVFTPILLYKLITYFFIFILGGLVNETDLKPKKYDMIVYTVYIFMFFCSLIYLNTQSFTILIFLGMYTMSKILNSFLHNENELLKYLTHIDFSIYLLHYIFVVWINYFFLDINGNIYLKSVFTFIVSLILSIITAVIIKKRPIVT